jgi:acyl carrier protein phosphodiesterase
MNYLAHAYLSGEDEDLLIGNFIADHIRGNNFSAYSEGIIKGIQMHRKIDTFTDAHPLFKASKRLFYDGFEKYSGVLVDIYFDHLLAKNFSQYHSQDLQIFSEQVYAVYTKNRHLLPESSNRFLHYVIQNNIYTNYGSTKGIETVLKHLSSRIGHGISLNQSIPHFEQAEAELQTNFSEFMLDLKSEF